MERSYIHGTTFDSCELCDKQINEFNRGICFDWLFNENKKFTVINCQECFNDSERQEWIKEHNVSNIRDYEKL